MTFLLFVRRLHLYLGLFLLPWVVLFGLSSFPFNHPVPVQPRWSVRVDRASAINVPEGADLRTLGARIMADAGLTGGFYVNRPNPQRITVNHPNFFHPTRVTYFIDQKKLLAEDREFIWRQFLTSMHAHAGYEMQTFWDTVWAVMVDLASIGLMLWILSGLIMWWMLPGSRGWGWVAIAGGLACFMLIVASL
jgi:hypothetical protein